MKGVVSPEKVVATNRKAFHDYHLEETYEAGVSLLGTEVKALRETGAVLRDSFARIEGEEVYLYHCHINPYSHGGRVSHTPLRPRKLLLHREEIRKLGWKVQQQGYTLVPLKVYFKEGLAKVELALARGKKSYDRRETLKKKEAEREVARVLKAKRHH